MKQMLTIGFLVLLALAACTPSAEVAEHGRSEEGPNPELSAIDSLMWRQPDSALAVLQQFAASPKADSLDELNGHYCQLLISELLYKNDYGQSNRPALQQAVRYFDSLCLCKGVARNISTIAFLDARAHYINGVGYYERDSVVEACKEYLKALEVMEGRFEEGELTGKKARFMALIYTHLTGLFSDFYLHEQTINFGKKSLLYYQKFDALSWHMAWVLNELGSQYDMLDNMDSAAFYYQTASDILYDTCNTIYRDINTHQTCLRYKTDKQTEFAITQMYRLLSEAENDKEFLSRCLNIGEIYYHEQLFDSAWHYLNKVYQETLDVSCKKQSAEWLLEICKTQGRDSEILKYASFLAPFANREENQSAIKSQLTELYNVLRQREMELQHQVLVRRNVKRTMTVVCILLSVILMLLILHLKRKQKFNAQLEAESYAHKMEQKALSGRLRKSNDALRDSIKKIKEQEMALEISKNDSFNNLALGNYEAFMQTQICQEIMKTIDRLHSDKRKTLKTDIDVKDYKDFSLSTIQLNSLTKTVELHFIALYSTLKTLNPYLDRNDWLHCCLYLMQIDKMSICVLLQESYQSCRRRTLKLEQKFNVKDDITSFLLNVVSA